VPYTYRIDLAAGTIEVFGETGTDFDCRTVLEAVLRDPAYRPGLGILRDRTGQGVVDSNSLRRCAAMLNSMQARLRGTRIAVVAPEDANYGTIRMLERMVGEHIELAVFRCETEAREWLAARAGGSPAVL
jgi:hypothetical protein